MSAATCTDPRLVSIEVCRLELDVSDDRAATLRALLSADELERTRRLRFEVDQRRFAVGRALVRTRLGEFLDEPPETLRFTYGPAGKPSLSDFPQVAFNASGSRGVGLLAVGVETRLGIDIELPEPGVDDLGVARQFFCRSEIDELTALPHELRQLGFLRTWTRKEAYVKALGDGLQAGLDRFAVSAAPDAPALRWSARGDADRWTIVDLSEPARGTVAALCHDSGKATGVRWLSPS